MGLVGKMIKNIFLCCYFLTTIQSSLLSADTNTNPTIAFPVQFNISGIGTHLFQRTVVANISPGYVLNKDLSNQEHYNQINDNPLKHSAFFFDFGLKTKLSGINLDLDIIGEHRGVSYGTFNTKEMIVFPKYNVSFDTSFSLFNQKILIGTNFGNVDNAGLYEGLTIYNLDIQSIDVYLQWKMLRLSYHQIGDMAFNIGLNIDDQFDYILSLEDIKISDDWISTFRVGYTYLNKIIYYKDPIKNNEGMSISANLRKDKFKLYTQFSIKDLNYSGVNNSGNAFLAGINYKYADSTFESSICSEYRFYGSYFNQDFINTTVSYRNYNNYGNSFDNTIGKILYPLYFYERPFSQWAVYTEYQNISVSGFILQINSKYRFYKDFKVLCFVDLNYIKPGNYSGIICPFYNIGLSWEPQKIYSFQLTATNRGMNLDKHYPTLYLYSSPQIMLQFHYNFNPF